LDLFTAFLPCLIPPHFLASRDSSPSLTRFSKREIVPLSPFGVSFICVICRGIPFSPYFRFDIVPLLSSFAGIDSPSFSQCDRAVEVRTLLFCRIYLTLPLSVVCVDLLLLSLLLCGLHLPAFFFSFTSDGLTTDRSWGPFFLAV